MGRLQVTVPGLIDTARQLVGAGKGLLAMDESNGTCNKRFAALGIAQTEEKRRAYRELIVTTPGLGDSISGAILYDETLHQRTKGGALFVDVLTAASIVPGIKVDTGATDLADRPGEKITEGLDGLRDRLKEYAGMGARFAKWRAVITLGDGLPSRGCIEANAQSWTGVSLDDAQNRLANNPLSDIASRVIVMVVASQEGEHIARHTWALWTKSLS